MTYDGRDDIMRPFLGPGFFRGLAIARSSSRDAGKPTVDESRNLR